mmetsp:Transcript_9517/g.15576  ORF Transcript_9517/g.15576 Transcript_9517/m.15576 type:complete len:529 (-) Transcript_9517:484-2070(-)|eukprot:CAMPEP_0184657076 /NCGR_PEP_ID=MMETSP0308-20130426/16959_1 /TAXON_ID=38269 /ORGANISM="Gloeochaete witrockiana, Strain SAG 46.84" /LENGTH=528 /DNA_ID=CAMNT_0027094475 /DNA_START=110 /DNA_END=1696 /DNA_ORIENTATION=-
MARGKRSSRRLAFVSVVASFGGNGQGAIKSDFLTQQSNANARAFFGARSTRHSKQARTFVPADESVPTTMMVATTAQAPAASSPTVSVKTAMTMTEKILAKASGNSSVKPGDNIWVNCDVLMTHDVCGPGTIGNFHREFGSQAKVFDKEKIVLIPDHYIFTADERANRNVDILREFAKEQDIKYFYDITDRSNFKLNPDYKGVCHVALAQEGHCRPGEILFGTDSHTCNAGAFGEFATGIGNTDASFIMGTGKLLIKVPQTMRFVLDGEMPPYLLAKDLILQIIGDISVSGATYRTMEFAGTAVERMSMEERMVLCNMVIEAGGKNGVIAPDSTTMDYVMRRTTKPFCCFYSDEDATWHSTRHYDVSTLEPVVAKPHSPDNKAKVSEVKGTHIDRVYIGSCTGGKTEDFYHAAELLNGQTVKVPTYIVPATQRVYNDLHEMKIGEKTLAQIFADAGCVDPAAPSCAACLGGPKDTFGRLNTPEVCVSTTNRNFPGRMGEKTAQVYLASPYTAAASAIAGVIADPRDYF